MSVTPTETTQRRLVIISGVSGAGKSTALKAFEDLGYFCVDNLPAPLITPFIDFLIAPPSGEVRHSDKFALLVDCREESSFPSIRKALNRLHGTGMETEILFLDCDDDVAIRRFQETRRPHPLLVSGSSGMTVTKAIAKERELLEEFRSAASRTLDTSSFTPHDLRRAIQEFVGSSTELEISLLSFGFKYGVPHDADLIVDVRFLPNPHFVAGLGEKTGLEEKVRDYVFCAPDAQQFVEQYAKLLEFLIPRYRKEGKRYLTIAIGCTGGRHRSVAISEAMSAELRKQNLQPAVRHRDIQR